MPRSPGVLLWSTMSYHAAILAAIDDLKDCHLTGSSLTSIRHHVQASLPEGKSFRDSAFLRSLKKAVDKGELVQMGGGGGDHYRLSREYKERRAELLKEESERRSRQVSSAARQKQQQRLQGHQKVEGKKAPPNGIKEAPKRPPEKAKKKLTDRGGVVTVVVEGRKTEKMELEKEGSGKDAATRRGGEGKVGEKVLEHKEAPRRRSSSVKTKITPRRVLKHAVKDPMETI